MCDAKCDGGVRCAEPAEARRARQRISYAMSLMPAGIVASAVPTEPGPVEPQIEPPRKPDLNSFGSDHPAAELAVTAWGAELSRRAHEIAGITPEEILAGSRQRQRQAELELPELESIYHDALDVAKLCQQRRDTPPEDDADPELVQVAWNGSRTWKTDSPRGAAYKDARERSNLLYQTYREALVLVQTAGQGKDEETIRQLDLVSAAYLQVLAQERPMGGKVAVGKQSSPRAKAALVDAVRIYPTDWIQVSNEAQVDRPLMAVANPGRAFYRHEGRLTVKADGAATRRIFQDAGWAPPPEETSDYELDEPEAVFNGRSGTIWLEKVYEKKYQREQPRGPGWEPAGDRIWRRPKTAEQSIQVSELRVGLREFQGGQIGVRPGAATAAHEFGHRCQRLVPNISELERAFLDRRTAGTELEPYSKAHADEWVQPDGFADRYMGKDYREGKPGVFQEEESKSTEILTTGVEAIFANRFGALAGLNGLNPDPDMRNFVLGMMAVL